MGPNITKVEVANKTTLFLYKSKNIRFPLK